ncbi:MAG: type II toxin-antitoxin system RelE/ParE family toxin [Armatimonadetes bacterium]|nr:type II toxin-antitoxin system RelE/ParE family toxin [Armatimonadota bacterium]
MRLKVSNGACNFISTRDPKHQRQIVAKIQTLRTDPSPPDSKALKGSSREYRRADIGEYRIIYRIEDNVLHVSAVGKRNDDEIYHRFGRR